jgi:hypothetical protein
MDYIIGFITTALGTILGWLLSECSNKKNRIRNASENFKDAFLDELVKFERSTIEIEGTVIYDVLIKSYAKHCAAVYRLRSNLAGKQLIGFNSLWHQYQYPDNKTDSGPLGYYITPDEKGNVKMVDPKFVYHKIESLLIY